MKHRSRGFRKWVREEDGYAVKAHYCSSCLITIPFPLEIAAWRKGDRVDLAVEQSVPTHPSSIHPFSCLAMDGWRRYHSRGEIIASRNNPGELRCITAGKREGFFEGVGALVGFDSLFIR